MMRVTWVHGPPGMVDVVDGYLERRNWYVRAWRRLEITREYEEAYLSSESVREQTRKSREGFFVIESNGNRAE